MTTHTTNDTTTDATVWYEDRYDPDHDFDRWYTLATARRIAREIGSEDRVLELGCAKGLMFSTILSATSAASWLAVDHAPPYLEAARSRGVPGVEFARSAFEDLELPEQGFEHILLTNVLQELDDPLRVLRLARGWLAPGGRLHLTLPNPDSLHRLVALEMGLIEDTRDLGARGRDLLATTMWSIDEVRELTASVGLEVDVQEGLLMKPLTNAQMDTLSDATIEGFIAVAQYFPQHSSINYFSLRSA